MSESKVEFPTAKQYKSKLGNAAKDILLESIKNQLDLEKEVPFEIFAPLVEVDSEQWKEILLFLNRNGFNLSAAVSATIEENITYIYQSEVARILKKTPQKEMKAASESLGTLMESLLSLDPASVRSSLYYKYIVSYMEQ